VEVEGRRWLTPNSRENKARKKKKLIIFFDEA